MNRRNNMKKNQTRFDAVFTGSFDPFQNGHLSTVIKFLELNPKAFLYIVIAINEAKKNTYAFSTEEKKYLIEQTIPKKYLKRIKTVPYSKIVADYLYEQNIHMFVKGARDEKDFTYESWIAEVNSMFSGNPTTIIIPQTDQELVNVSSSTFKEFIKLGLDTKKFAPALTREALQIKLNKQFIVGATGGIASGKTTILGEIEKISKEDKTGNAPVYHISLDELGKRIYSNDPMPQLLAIREQVAKRFRKEAVKKFGKGAKLTQEDTSIDTYMLGSIAFSSKENLRELTGIVIEMILYLLRKKLEEFGEGIFVIESANLIEQNLTHLVNENIIMFGTAKKIQEERMRAKGYSEEQITRRIEFQLSNKEKLEVIREKQKNEKHRLFMQIDTSSKVDAKSIYDKLEEEYRKRQKIIQ